MPWWRPVAKSPQHSGTFRTERDANWPRSEQTSLGATPPSFAPPALAAAPPPPALAAALAAFALAFAAFFAAALSADGGGPVAAAAAARLVVLRGAEPLERGRDVAHVERRRRAHGLSAASRVRANAAVGEGLTRQWRRSSVRHTTRHAAVSHWRRRCLAGEPHSSVSVAVQRRFVVARRRSSLARSVHRATVVSSLARRARDQSRASFPLCGTHLVERLVLGDELADRLAQLAGALAVDLGETRGMTRLLAQW